jgi:glycosyltransferase involved in cell wall biosynthesis
MDIEPDISVVILCYKAGYSAQVFVDQVIEHLNSFTLDWEIILVGNYLKGDTDDVTPDVVRMLAASNPTRIKSVTLEKQGMMGWDVRSGLNVATGKTICFIDGDGQMIATDIGRIYQKLISEHLDMAKTYRERRDDGFLRTLNSKIYNLIFCTLFPGFHVRDVNSKPKILTREFLNKLSLKSDDWFLDAEIIIQARRLRANIGEIPTVFLEAKNRKSFVKLRHISEFTINLIIARLREFFV